MTKSQNTKNEQQKDLCITSEQLTEQYNHGNLPDDRLYYYRFEGELEVQITTQYGLYCEEADNKKEIEVIDFVPTFEELQNMNEAVNQSMSANIKLVEQNEQLKEQIERLEKQLKIATEALKDIIEEDMYNLDEHRAFIEQKLQDIKELEK